ncbi:hypothetical protein CQW23_26728 [Capsicum baccatum]|uniref:EF-hand domain-containing protein n=1 Tax=Capsicum baccatum TaxID=33114 RepID=A0A2G2VPM6_CAPBA|nr:hypothetical protein CQW23_26728 [Capsicum baccatum]
MCMVSVFVSTAEKETFFSRIWNRVVLKKATTHKEQKSLTTTTAVTTTDPLSLSSSDTNNGELERLFTYFDENGDGKVSPAELRRCMKAAGGMEEERNKECELIGAFCLYEMEGSGYITPKSLKRMLSRLGESTSIENCKAMISRFDINGDGVLSFDEFKVMMTN